MSGRIRFHFDEHISAAVADALRRRGIDVTTTLDAGLSGADDPAQLAFAASQGRVIVTQDRGFLRMDHDGVTHAGIVYWAQGQRSLGEIVRGLVMIYDVLTPDEMRQKVEYL